MHFPGVLTMLEVTLALLLSTTEVIVVQYGSIGFGQSEKCGSNAPCHIMFSKRPKNHILKPEI